MPFGFERELQKENETAEQMSMHKKFISVGVTYTPDGKLIPHSFFWEGREYKIDRVLNCRSGNSLKHSEAGTRYECAIKNKKFYLHFTGEKWYLDV